jgi:hypothetical protein
MARQKEQRTEKTATHKEAIAEYFRAWGASRCFRVSENIVRGSTRNWRMNKWRFSALLDCGAVRRPPIANH